MRNQFFKKVCLMHKKSGLLYGIRIYDVAGISCRNLRQMITLLLVPQLLVQPQRPSSSYDECSS